MRFNDITTFKNNVNNKFKYKKHANLMKLTIDLYQKLL